MRARVSVGEFNKITRRRLGLTQVQACHEEGISKRQLVKGEKNTNYYGEVELTEGEWCALMRWRSGKKQSEVAADLNFCPMWVREMELDRVEASRLVRYWS